MSKPRSSCLPSATASPAFLFCETGRPGATWQSAISMRLPPPVSVAHSAIAQVSRSPACLVRRRSRPARAGAVGASGYDPRDPILFVVLVQLLPALDNKPRLAQKPDRCVGILVAEKISR
jgi:hypothetical protein